MNKTSKNVVELINQNTAASGATEFQQAGASVQLQPRPLTKNLVWKNNVTVLNGRKMERQTLKGVVHSRETEDERGSVM